MKLTRVILITAFVLGGNQLSANLLREVSYRMPSQEWRKMTVNVNGASARTDEIVDSTTVEATLTNNVENLRWELRVKPAQGDSSMLTQMHDITPSTEIRVVMQIWPESHPQTLNSTKVMGDLTSFTYDEATDIATILGKPQDLTPSATYPLGRKSVFAAHLSYLGNSANHPGGKVNHGNAVIQSNVWIDDLTPPQHATSTRLLGSGFGVNGVAGTDARFSIYAQRSYAIQSFGGRCPMMAGGFIDGFQPRENFYYSAETVANDFTLTTRPQQNEEDDDVIRYNIGLRVNFSIRDFQIGYFNDPWLGSLIGESDWHFLDWFGWFNPAAQGWFFHSEAGWLYTPESSTYDNLYLYLQSLGWVYTSQQLFPYIYVFDADGSAFWAVLRRGTSPPVQPIYR